MRYKPWQDMEEPKMNITKWKKPIINHMIPTTCSGNEKVWSSKILANIRGWGGGKGWIGEAQKFLGW